MNSKIMKITTSVVVVIILAAAIVMMPQSDDGEKGLYRLNASYVEVGMGKCSASPVVVETIGQIYESYYGDLPEHNFTYDEVTEDVEFYEQYCKWEPFVSTNTDGTVTVRSSTSVYGDEYITMDVADSIVTMSTIFTDTLYYLLCQKHGVEPHSEESLNDDGLSNDLRSMIVGGLESAYYEDQGAEYMTSHGVLENYLDLGVKSVTKIDPEVLADVMSRASSDDSTVVYLAFGSMIREDKQYDANTDPCRNTGTKYVFTTPRSISDIFACIDAIGKIMGFDPSVSTGLIQDVQCELYTIYKSVPSNEHDGKPLVYWEYSSGKTVKTAMGLEMMEFLGFDTSMMDGSEYDLESILLMNPDLLCYYDGDTRTMDERMKVL